MPGEEDKGGAAASPPAAPAKVEEAEKAHPQPKKGWVKHIATDTFHEVDDVDTTLVAYPGQYEKASNPGANSKRIGWPE